MIISDEKRLDLVGKLRSAIHEGGPAGLGTKLTVFIANNMYGFSRKLILEILKEAI